MMLPTHTLGAYMTDVLICGVLGAAVLAIVLLYRSDRKKTKQLDELRADLTAQKIATLRQRTAAAPAAVEPEEEPARRKRHLALYIGGGAAAILAALGDRARAVWKRHRTATAVGAAVTVATVSTAAGLYLTSADGTPETSSALPPASSAPGPATQPDNAVTPGAESLPPDPDGADFDPADVSAPIDVASPGNSAGSATTPTTDDEPGPSSPPSADASQPGRTPGIAPATDGSPAPGSGSGSDESGGGQDQAPDDNGPGTTPPPPAPETSAPPVTTPQPAPTTEQPPSKPGKDCTVHVQLPPLLDLCL